MLIVLLSNLLLVTAPLAILLVVTASLAISSAIIVPFAIFDVVIALAATAGEAAVPVKSPANCTLPFTESVASGAPEVTLEST